MYFRFLVLLQCMLWLPHLLVGNVKASITSCAPIPEMLTQRELQVLCLIAEGITEAEIAKKLLISPNTVHAHTYSIYSKLDISCRVAAARFAIKHGLA
jgi:DNA-binding NarL/FixJ family response regulator